MKLIFATRNAGKLRELQQLLAIEGVEVVNLDALDVPEVEETGETFAENATLKAVEVMKATGLPTLADDSGLEVDALDGAPGVRSARYAGEGASDADRVQLLLRELSGVEESGRTARFRCVVAFADPARTGQVELRQGSCEGRIITTPRGENGFGYDPVFFVQELGCTFAEARAEDKNLLSHRGKAMQQMADHLRRHLGRPITDANEKDA